MTSSCFNFITYKILLKLPINLLTLIILSRWLALVEYPFWKRMTQPSDSDTHIDQKMSALKDKRRVRDSNLRIFASPDQYPIVYSSKYDVTFYGLEKMHPFDSQKWGKVFRALKDAHFLTNHNYVIPNEATREDLLLAHTSAYLDTLKQKHVLAKAMEVPLVGYIPFFSKFADSFVLAPFRHHVGGTVAAACLALERGWAINIGGGFHHAASEKAGGFCLYNDVTIAIRFLLQGESIKKAMIIDLDAHQGNGYERAFTDDDRVYIFDMFNRNAFPRDEEAKKGINLAVPLKRFTEDEEYIEKLETHIVQAFNEFTPDLIVYNAGTDVFDADHLGCLSITEDGIEKRDEIVFKKAADLEIPIVMVTSGGYTEDSANIITQSILNLKKKGLLPLTKTQKPKTDTPKPKTEKSFDEVEALAEKIANL
uniref:Histone deacetylase 11 n=1 Tax=Panagrellus redivivus TaxID=6233 RepID=A0A7E4VNX8_PANRE